MSDQLRWWKLWVSALDDPDLAALDAATCWRWAALGAYIRAHGVAGTVTVARPGSALLSAWRVRGGGQRMGTLLRIARALPGVIVQADGDDPKSVTLTMRNWHKYQEDSSAQRTKAWRDRQRQRDGQQTVTRDGQPASRETEQTRRDETVPPTPVGESSQPATAQQRRHAELAARLARPIAGSTAPPEAWRYDCPDKRYHGRCVDRAWAAAHPDVSMPVVPDDHGGYRPRECPHHKAQP